MEFNLPTLLSSEAATILVPFLLFLYCLLRWKQNTYIKKEPPQPAGSWPVIGHLHLLGALPHISLGKLADTYGSIFMIKLGVHRALVVSSPEMVKECLGSNDKVFLDRPQTVFVEHLCYNSAMFGFTRYGPYWRELRKIMMVEQLSNHRLEMLKHFRVTEVRSAIKEIFNNHQAKIRSSGAASDSESVDMTKWFSDINLNTSVRLIAGKSLKEFYQGEEYNRWKKAFRDFFELAGATVPGDAFPFLRWLDIGGYEKAMKKAANEINIVLQRWLEEHKERKIAGQAKGNQDFMDVMLGILETGLDIPTKFEADVIIKATCLTMLLGGTDTTAVTLIWALSLLLKNRDTLEKAQAELDAQIGRERQVDESDLKNLIYIQAILKETMRLYPAAPLSVPREAITDCALSGYNIPAGTHLFVNIYKLHRDPEVWLDPLEFHPERFLTTHKGYEVRGQTFELLPFGTGRRICPGISFALQSMQLTLANLLHGFEILTPPGETIDMSEGSGLTNLKASPLKVILISRLSDNLYDN